MADAYPLSWPAGWARTKTPKRARFETSFANARDGVMDELNRMGCADHRIVISTNIQTRRDGLPYASHREPDDSGVAVYFQIDGREQCIPCDRWDRVRDNMQAIHKTIAALRGLERWGAQDMVNAAFRGFAALPGPEDAVGTHWSDVLGTHAMSTDTEIREAYRRRCREYHPDSGKNGGDAEMFHAVQEAWAQAKQERDL